MGKNELFHEIEIFWDAPVWWFEDVFNAAVYAKQLPFKKQSSLRQVLLVTDDREYAKHALEWTNVS